jgi:hypothetical protein
MIINELIEPGKTIPLLPELPRPYPNFDYGASLGLNFSYTIPPQFLSKYSFVLTDLIKKIKKDCSRYYPLIIQTPLYRGLAHTYLHAFTGRSHNDRRVRNSVAMVSKTVDNILRILQIKTRRSNSIFATSSRTMAHYFGNLYVIFPKNNADFLWFRNPDYKDCIFDCNFLEKFQKLRGLNLVNDEIGILNKKKKQLYKGSRNSMHFIDIIIFFV